jgi:hypothetical protein
MNDELRSKFEDQARRVGRRKLPPEWRAGILEAALRDREAQEATWEEVVEIVEPETTGDVVRLEGRIRKAERRAMWSMAACFVLTLVLAALVFRPRPASEKEQDLLEHQQSKAAKRESAASGEPVRDALAKLGQTIRESALNSGEGGRVLKEASREMNALQFRVDASDDSFRPMEADSHPLPPSKSTSSSVAGQHSDGASWGDVTVSGGVFASQDSGEGGVSLDRLAVRRGTTLDGPSAVGAVPGGKSSSAAGDPHTPVGTLQVDPTSVVAGVQPNLKWNIETREEFEADHSGYRPASSSPEDLAQLLPLPDIGGEAFGGRLGLEDDKTREEPPPQRSIRQKRPFVIAANPSSNVTEEVRYQIDEAPPGGVYQREIGVKLAVTPTVLPDGTVRMRMRPRTARVVDEVIGQSGHRYPASEALLEKFASIPPGHSLVVGGFYGQAKKKDGNKVPLLGDIPEINIFLKGKEAAWEDPSLLFVVTPTIRRNESGGKDLVTFNTKILKVNDGVAGRARVDWPAAGVPAEETGGISSLLGIEGAEPGTGGPAAASDGSIVLSAEQTEGVLRALEKGGLVRQLSNPTLLTEDNVQATISLVDRVPVITTTANHPEAPEPEPEPLPEEPEKDAKEEPWSTFSLNVSDVSFKLAKASLARGEWPAPDQVRVEEFVNAFDYGDQSPSQEEKVACNFEQAVHPFLQQRNLLRVSMKTAAMGRAANTPLRLTVLLDNSGSMDRADRVDSVKNAFQLLAAQLNPEDRVTLIGFARTPRLLADRVTGDKVAELVRIIDSTPSAGGTNLEEALKLGLEKAREQLLEGAQNRIILLTDGAVNLGNARPQDLATLVGHMRGNGIAFDACGVGADGLNDEVLEALTRKGDGRYYFLDRPEDADDGFARQIAGALRPAARNVKVQVKFNPDRVGRYKLYGFNKHRLKKEDFRDDSVDAAELAAAEAGNAIYQFEPLPEGSGDVGTVSVRFQDIETGQMIERQWTIPYAPRTPRLEDAAPSMRLASLAALLGEKLKGSPVGETVEMEDLGSLLSGLPGEFPADQRVTDLVEMTRKARELGGE